MKMKAQRSKTYEILRGKFIAIQSYLKKQQKHKQPNLTLKATRERRKTKPKVSRRKEIIKIKAEINGVERKKTIEQINETKG